MLNGGQGSLTLWKNISIAAQLETRTVNVSKDKPKVIVLLVAGSSTTTMELDFLV